MRRIIVSFLVVLGSGACATSGPNQGEFNLVSMDQEIAIGKQFDRQLRGEKRVLDDPESVAYLQGLTNRLMKGAPKSPVKFEVRAVDDSAINAFAAPGGRLYVNTGLVRAAANESELAGVMAHEMGHAVERHVTEQMSKMYGFQILGSLALGQNPGMLQQLVAQLGGTVVFLKFGRDAEREADQLAVRYTSAGNIDPAGLVTFFEKLKREEGKSPPGFLALLSTHPFTPDRIHAAEIRIAKIDRRGKVVDTRAFQRFRSRLLERVAARQPSPKFNIQSRRINGRL